MKSKIAFATAIVASLLSRPPEVVSQQPPLPGYVPYPQVLPGYGPAVPVAYGPAAPVQYITVMPSPANAQLRLSQVPPQVPPGSIPPSIVQPMPAASPIAMDNQAPLGAGVGDVGSDGCDACPTCSQCGGPSCDGQCDGMWDAYGACGARPHLWEQLSILGPGSLLSDGCFGLGQHPALCRMGSWLGFGQYPRPSRVWGEGEYLLWWNKNRALPVLVTTSVDGTPFNQAGVLGEPGTSILFGGGKIDNAAESGYRAGIGLWLDRYQTWGIGGRYFQLGPEDIGFDAASEGSPILARPFYNVDLGQQDALVVAYPGESSGEVQALASNELRGFDAYLRKMLYYGYCNRVDLILGYHNTQVYDTVRVGHRLVTESDQGPIPMGTIIDSEDRFRAKNEFHGGEIGLMTQGYDGRVSWNLLAKISAGNTRETVTLRGQTVTTVPGFGSATSNQGLLVLDTNSGVYEDDEFTLVPEASVSMAYSLTNLVQLSVGYSLIYWTNVALADDAIDTMINPTQIGGPLVGPAQPAYSLSDGSFWAQGLTFGIHGRF